MEHEADISGRENLREPRDHVGQLPTAIQTRDARNRMMFDGLLAQVDVTDFGEVGDFGKLDDLVAHSQLPLAGLHRRTVDSVEVRALHLYRAPECG